MKILFIIYADMDSMLEKIDAYHNNPEKSSATKINKHATSGYSLFTHCSFDATKNSHDYYGGEYCMKNFLQSLKLHATKTISYERKNWYHSQVKEVNHTASKKFIIYAKKNLVLIIKIKNTIKYETIVIAKENIEVLLITYEI